MALRCSVYTKRSVVGLWNVGCSGEGAYDWVFRIENRDCGLNGDAEGEREAEVQEVLW